VLYFGQGNTVILPYPNLIPGQTNKAMFIKLLALFILLPLAELALLVYIGTLIGVAGTLVIVLATGLTGALLARFQGTATINRVRRDMAQGIIPAADMLQGALIFAGGVMLLTPGLITDTFGFALLLPWSRRWITLWLRRVLEKHLQSGRTTYWRIR